LSIADVRYAKLDERERHSLEVSKPWSEGRCWWWWRGGRSGCVVRTKMMWPRCFSHAPHAPTIRSCSPCLLLSTRSAEREPIFSSNRLLGQAPYVVRGDSQHRCRLCAAQHNCNLTCHWPRCSYPRVVIQAHSSVGGGRGEEGGGPRLGSGVGGVWPTITLTPVWSKTQPRCPEVALEHGMNRMHRTLASWLRNVRRLPQLYAQLTSPHYRRCVAAASLCTITHTQV
jgi:hypothetical protein